MFNRHEKLKRRLDKVLTDYERLANSDPQQLRLLIPTNEIWRFFIEGRRQLQSKNLADCLDFEAVENARTVDYKSYSLRSISQSRVIFEGKWQKLTRYLHLTDEESDRIKLADLLRYNTGWFFFEKSEPNYLKSLYRAFDLIFTRRDQLDLNFICKLHETATSEVKNTNYDRADSITDKGSIRAQPYIGFPITTINASEDGLREFIARHKYYSYLMINHEMFIPAFDYTSHYYLKKTEESKSLRIKQPELYEQLVSAKSIPTLWKVLLDLIDSGIEVSCCSWLSNLNGDIASALSYYARQYINDFSDAHVNVRNRMGQLLKIIHLISMLEQLHPFDDANCRSLCMLLINHLLIAHNFPLAIFYDPNCFDMRSEEELLEMVIEGMEDTFKLIEQKELYGVKTADLETLSTLPNTFGVRPDYFKEVVAIEERARRRLTMSLNSSNKRKLEEGEDTEKHKFPRFG